MLKDPSLATNRFIENLKELGITFNVSVPGHEPRLTTGAYPRKGEYIYKIVNSPSRVQVYRRKILKVTDKGRIISDFGKFNGIKPEALGQFNQLYRAGHYITYSLESDLLPSIEQFKNRCVKTLDIPIQRGVFHYY